MLQKINPLTGKFDMVQDLSGYQPLSAILTALSGLDDTVGLLKQTGAATFTKDTNTYLTSVVSDSPLTGAGTSASHLSMPAATSSQNGYLSSADWTTFNGKESVLTFNSPLSRATNAISFLFNTANTWTGGNIFTGSATPLTIGNAAAGVDYQLKFDGENNDCTLTWYEDEKWLGISTGAGFGNNLTIGVGAGANYAFGITIDTKPNTGFLAGVPSVCAGGIITNYSSSSFICGFSHSNGTTSTEGSAFVLVAGAVHTLDGLSSGATVTGYQNNVESSTFCSILGSANTISNSPYCTVGGGMHTLTDSQLSFTAGIGNTLTGVGDFVLGAGCAASGVLTWVFGSNLSVSADETLAFGLDQATFIADRTSYSVYVTSTDTFLVQGINKITTPSFDGGDDDLDDMSSGGTYTGTADLTYVVEIDNVGTPNKFKWSDDGGSTWDATGVSITGAAQTLNNGVTVTFDATTGHTLGNYWEFIAYAHTGKIQEWQDKDASVKASLDKSGIFQPSGYKSSDGTSGGSYTVALAKLTALGSDGSMTVKDGIVTAYTAPT